jgi:hypothetical protein
VAWDVTVTNRAHTTRIHHLRRGRSRTVTFIRRVPQATRGTFCAVVSATAPGARPARARLLADSGWPTLPTSPAERPDHSHPRAASRSSPAVAGGSGALLVPVRPRRGSSGECNASSGAVEPTVPKCPARRSLRREQPRAAARTPGSTAGSTTRCRLRLMRERHRHRRGRPGRARRSARRTGRRSTWGDGLMSNGREMGGGALAAALDRLRGGAGERRRRLGLGVGSAVLGRCRGRGRAARVSARGDAEPGWVPRRPGLVGSSLH